jgi:hypothetical protein
MNSSRMRATTIDAAAGDLGRPVHDQQVAVLDAGAGHRVAAAADEGGRGRVLDQVAIQVDPALQVVPGGRRDGKPAATGKARSGQAPGGAGPGVRKVRVRGGMAVRVRAGGTVGSAAHPSDRGMARVFLAEGTATVVEDEPDLGWDL